MNNKKSDFMKMNSMKDRFVILYYLKTICKQ